MYCLYIYRAKLEEDHRVAQENLLKKIQEEQKIQEAERLKAIIHSHFFLIFVRERKRGCNRRDLKRNNKRSRRRNKT
jgi:hypothetical protein